jgi:hypothetical protein
MIWSAVSISKDGNYTASQGQIVGLMIGLLCIHGLLNCFPTRQLAWITKYFVFINVGTTIIIIIVLLATTPRHEMNAARMVFGSPGVVNGTSGNGISAWPTGIAFLYVIRNQVLMTDLTFCRFGLLRWVSFSHVFMDLSTIEFSAFNGRYAPYFTSALQLKLIHVDD